MPRLKTLLSPEEQWNCTVAYLSRVRNFGPKGLTHVAGLRLCVVGGAHQRLVAGDVLVCAPNNGMVLRYPVYGVTSKGARLNHRYLSIARMDELVLLPGDLIDARWDDPAVARFVADLRASSRSRVGACSPAPRADATPGQGGQVLRFDGWYRSDRQGVRERHRWYWTFLRFFADGTVVAHSDGHPSCEAWVLSADYSASSSGRFSLAANHLSFTTGREKWVVDCEGKVEGDQLLLTSYSHSTQRRSHRVYRFVAMSARADVPRD